MLKKTIILSILGAFLLQTIVFNFLLYAFTLATKYEEKIGNTKWIEFSEEQYSRLRLNETEFIFNNNLFDIIASKKENNTIKLLCKIDEKEKDLLEKLIENFKHAKTKKLISFSLIAELNPANDYTSFLNTNYNVLLSYFTSSVIESNIEQVIPPPKS